MIIWPAPAARAAAEWWWQRLSNPVFDAGLEPGSVAETVQKLHAASAEPAPDQAREAFVAACVRILCNPPRVYGGDRLACDYSPQGALDLALREAGLGHLVDQSMVPFKSWAEIDETTGIVRAKGGYTAAVEVIYDPKQPVAA